MVRAVKRSRKRCESRDFSEAPRVRPLSPEYMLFLEKRLAEQSESSQSALGIQSDKSLNGTGQDQTTLVSEIDIQGKLSSDVVTSTSKPQTPSSSLDETKKTLGSQVSLRRCSACMQIIPSDKSLNRSSDQDHTTLVSQIDIQEELSSDIVSTTSKTHQGKHVLSSSKMHKPKAFLKKKKNKKNYSRKVVSTA